ncbi:hypothetical protein U1Q18_043366, partial [Sarracenia purpurea var. burkii]
EDNASRTVFGSDVDREVIEVFKHVGGFVLERGRIGIDNEIPGGEGEGTDGKEEVADLVLEEVECDSKSCGWEIALGTIAGAVKICVDTFDKW